MNFENPILLVLIGAIVVAAISWKVARYLSSEAKRERRRRRSNAPIASNAKHPTVKFSVNVDKKKE